MPPGASSTRTTATWRAAGTTSSPVAGDDQRGLDKLIVQAEQRYTEVGSQLAKRSSTRSAKAKAPDPGLAAAA